MKECLKLMSGSAVDYIGTVVIGTVKGDLHDIGKNLVAAMLEGAGFKVVDLGVDVSAEKFVEAAKANNANTHRHVGPSDHHHGLDMRDTVSAVSEARAAH